MKYRDDMKLKKVFAVVDNDFNKEIVSVFIAHDNSEAVRGFQAALLNGEKAKTMRPNLDLINLCDIRIVNDYEDNNYISVLSYDFKSDKASTKEFAYEKIITSDKIFNDYDTKVNQETQKEKEDN